MLSTDGSQGPNGIHRLLLGARCYPPTLSIDVIYFIPVLHRSKMTDSITKTQRQKFEHFTMQDLMNPTECQVKAQADLFQPYIEERFFFDDSKLPDLEVYFANIDVRKPPQDGKEWYQALLQFRPTGTPTRETRMALGNQLMTKLSLWTLLHTNKPRLDHTISNTKGRMLIHYANIKLHSPCMRQALILHRVNQGSMDQIADTLLRASSTHFNMHMTMHEE